MGPGMHAGHLVGTWEEGGLEVGRPVMSPSPSAVAQASAEATALTNWAALACRLVRARALIRTTTVHSLRVVVL